MAIPNLQTLPSTPLPDTLDPPSPVIIERVQPELDAGRYPVKRVQGDILEVTADIFKDGHDKIAAVVKYRRQDEEEWREAEMRFVDNDRWAGEILLPDNTRYRYTIEAFPDRWATWCDEVTKKFDAGQDVALELLEGRAIISEALPRAEDEDQEILEQAIAVDGGDGPQATKVRILLAPEVEAAMRRVRSRRGKTVYAKELEVVVDRPAARFAAWYEMFPRSAGTDPTRGATLRRGAKPAPRHCRDGVRRRLPHPHPPHRHGVSQGQEQHPRRGRGRPRRPLRHWQRRRRPRRDRTGSGHPRRLPILRRQGRIARHGGRPRRRSASLPGPSLGQGAPGVVHHPPRRHHPLRRKPAQEVPGHLPPQLRHPRLARALA